MTVIDLHGIRHKDVYYKLESPCVDGELPFMVVTGHSSTMKKIVEEIVSSFGLKVHEKVGNPGRLIVCRGR